MYQPENKPTIAEYLRERGVGHAPQVDPRQLRDDARQDAIKAKAANIAEWRNYIPTTTPASTLDNLRAVRERAGLSLGEVSEIVGQHPSLVEAAEDGKTTLADDALKAFVGAVTTALQARNDA